MPLRGFVVAALSVVALSSLGDAQEAPQSIVGTGVSITVQRGRVTANITNAPLLAVLDELSRRTRVAIVPADGLDAEYVSADLKNVAMDEGVRELLKNCDAFYYYSPGTRRQMASLAAVWVYPRGAASTLRPVPPEVWASGTDIEAALNDTDAGVRERGYDALMSRPDRTSHERVLLAIRGASERDPDLRERLLSTAITRGIELPRDVLADLVRADDVEGIRLMALDALSGDPAAREVGLAALSDPSEVVRQRARELLTELDSMTRRETSIR